MKKYIFIIYISFISLGMVAQVTQIKTNDPQKNGSSKKETVLGKLPIVEVSNPSLFNIYTIKSDTGQTFFRIRAGLDEYTKYKEILIYNGVGEGLRWEPLSLVYTTTLLGRFAYSDVYLERSDILLLEEMMASEKPVYMYFLGEKITYQVSLSKNEISETLGLISYYRVNSLLSDIY